jgi:hypothetical protein
MEVSEPECVADCDHLALTATARRDRQPVPYRRGSRNDWRNGVDSLYEPNRKDRQVVRDREEEALTASLRALKNSNRNERWSLLKQTRQQPSARNASGISLRRS